MTIRILKGHGILLYNRHIPSSGALDKNPNISSICGKKNKRRIYSFENPWHPPSPLHRVVTNGASGRQGEDPHANANIEPFIQSGNIEI